MMSDSEIIIASHVVDADEQLRVRFLMVQLYQQK